MSTTVDQRITEVAARQHGVVTLPQLREAGLSMRAVTRRVATGLLHRIHRGVYRVGPLEGEHTAVMAAVLACGPGARASHLSAGWLFGMIPRPADGTPVEVTVPVGRLVRRPGIKVYRSRRLELGGGGGSDRGDAGTDVIATVHGIPVTSPGRTLVDLAGVLPSGELERAVAQAARSGLVRLDQIARLVACHRGRAGIAALAAVVARENGPAFTRSEFERRFVEAVRRHGLPEPQWNVRIAGFEVDCWFRAARLVVELDSRAYHRSWRSQANDRRRDQALAARGIQVVRITWKEFAREPEKTMTRLAQAIALRTASAPASAG